MSEPGTEPCACGHKHECGARLNGFPDSVWPADPGCAQWQYGACTCETECPDDRPAAPVGSGEGHTDEVLRKAKADALREAADALIACPLSSLISPSAAAAWLQGRAVGIDNRADRIENGEQP